jgi:diacylglycerol kinase family enzyme
MIRVIANPSAGRGAPDYATLGAVFAARGAAWSLVTTRLLGHAEQCARAAAADGAAVVAVYGGDGTISDAARGLIGSDIPLLILPGGTANLLATELGIPRDLRAAAALAFDGAAQAVDMAQTGRHLFFHLGIGLEGEMVRRAGPTAKRSAGALAYYGAALGALWTDRARYRLALDGETVEISGINCSITTYGSLGVFGLALSHTVDPGDGWLDVFVIERADLPRAALASLSALWFRDLRLAVRHWRVRSVDVELDRPQPITLDSEIVTLNPIRARVVPGAARIFAPQAAY